MINNWGVLQWLQYDRKGCAYRPTTSSRISSNDWWAPQRVPVSTLPTKLCTLLTAYTNTRIRLHLIGIGGTKYHNVAVVWYPDCNHNGMLDSHDSYRDILPTIHLLIIIYGRSVSLITHKNFCEHTHTHYSPNIYCRVRLEGHFYFRSPEHQGMEAEFSKDNMSNKQRSPRHGKITENAPITILWS